MRTNIVVYLSGTKWKIVRLFVFAMQLPIHLQWWYFALWQVWSLRCLSRVWRWSSHYLRGCFRSRSILLLLGHMGSSVILSWDPDGAFLPADGWKIFVTCLLMSHFNHPSMSVSYGPLAQHMIRSSQPFLSMRWFLVVWVSFTVTFSIIADAGSGYPVIIMFDSCTVADCSDNRPIS